MDLDISLFQTLKDKGVISLEKTTDGTILLHSKRFDTITGDEVEETTTKLEVDGLIVEKQKLQDRIGQIDLILTDIESL